METILEAENHSGIASPERPEWQREQSPVVMCTILDKVATWENNRRFAVKVIPIDKFCYPLNVI